MDRFVEGCVVSNPRKSDAALFNNVALPTHINNLMARCSLLSKLDAPSDTRSQRCCLSVFLTPIIVSPLCLTTTFGAPVGVLAKDRTAFTCPAPFFARYSSCLPFFYYMYSGNGFQLRLLLQSKQNLTEEFLASIINFWPELRENGQHLCSFLSIVTLWIFEIEALHRACVGIQRSLMIILVSRIKSRGKLSEVARLAWKSLAKELNRGAMVSVDHRLQSSRSSIRQLQGKKYEAVEFTLLR